MTTIAGGICAVRGVQAAGVKLSKMGLALIVAKGSAAGVYTRNKVIAAPLIVTREKVNRSKELAAVIANSGNANAFTGEKGIADARQMCRMVAGELGVDEALVAVASTGVIGRSLDMGWLEIHMSEVVDGLTDTAKGGEMAARAIMTTDTVEKVSVVELGNGVRIGGIAKGSGMIEPNMGTMLGFIYTDASLPAEVLDVCLHKGVDRSFNMIVVDGDTSTNDMVLLTATGVSGIEPEIEQFQQGLDRVLTDLARQVARDGEGATKLIETRVKGARTRNDARIIAKTVVRSPLVKSAVFGRDPNWGRVMAAVGYSGADVDQDRMSLAFSNSDDTVWLVDNGMIIAEDEQTLGRLGTIMDSDEVVIMVDIDLGDATAVAWGCDLTYDYVRINAEYTT
ncbi:MAG: bifunctional ornithine acetyltransferase/N-acetylglutamate synthase [Methanosarcinaceae archaeon]|nr:bifunctional ornithine acetyltransferase/N-acetylglutamate synthase [Methanosarcinaceae archaeon]